MRASDSQMLPSLPQLQWSYAPPRVREIAVLGEFESLSVGLRRKEPSANQLGRPKLLTYRFQLHAR